ncbi:MAG: DUF4097 family beta strand repeat-containing protein [Acholeplasmataceae bacterium]|nr:DUF4097 family beta strand repeat-containing protein [Acholeplasmataceae bacterium]
MKFVVKVFVFLTVVGFIMIGVAFLGGMDASRLTNTFNQSEAYGDSMHYTQSETLNKLILDITVKHVEMFFSETEELKVTYYSHTDDTWEFIEDLGVLTIKQTQKMRPFFGFNFGFVDRYLLTITIEIPKNWVMDYEISTHTGDIKFIGIEFTGLSHLTTGLIDLETDTGNIEVKDLSASRIELKTDTGDIALLNLLVMQDLTASSSTGVIHLEDSSITDVIVNGSTGRVEIENLEVSTLDIGADTSRVNVVDTIIDSMVKVRISTGKIYLDKTSAQAYDLKTNTGDIEVNLNSIDVIKFDLNAGVGKITIDGINQGDRHVTTIGTIDLIAETDTGNIEINVRD